ncbi:MAG: phosphoglycerate dehydrogenase [Chloroflexota bacterium]|nr:phosphoglycerate dehydrogenase [Chloroflexota bacterium]
MTHTVLIATDLTDDALNLLQDAADIAVKRVPPNPSALKSAIKDAHALIARDDVQIDAALLADAPQLRVIGRVGTSLSGIAIDAATERGIVVMHTPGANAVAAGEHTFALMLALCRRLVAAHNSLRDGYWLLDRKRQAGTQLQGKTLGLVGLGRVGAVVAARALAFGMTVLATDPYLPDDALIDERVLLVGLRELLSRSDIVSLHVPATAATRGLLSAETIAQMKPGARLINTAHGSIIDEAALAAALKDGRLAGAAVDVFHEEPPYNSPLVGLENVIHTPHIGDNTVEASQDLSIQIARQVIDALRGDDFRNVVNLPFIAGMDFETARPAMQLAERMGLILHALARNPIQRVAVEYRGEEMAGMVKPLTVALLKGMLAPSVGEIVNYVNAPIVASERGIQVTQTKGLKTGDFATLVSVQVTLADGETILMAGTLMDRREPHIVQINDYRLNVVPKGDLLIMGSFDQPGVIGKTGMLLASYGVNIATWQTGRAERGGHTLTVLTLDEPLPQNVFDDLTAQEFVRHAHQVRV